MENSETPRCYRGIDFAFEPEAHQPLADSCNYIDKNIKQGLENKTTKIGRLLNHMIENPKKYQKKSNPPTDGSKMGKLPTVHPSSR